MFEDLLEQHIQMQNEALRKSREKESLISTFAFQPDAIRETALQSLSPRSQRVAKDHQTPALKSLAPSMSVQAFCEVLPQKEDHEKMRTNRREKAYFNSMSVWLAELREHMSHRTYHDQHQRDTAYSLPPNVKETHFSGEG